MNRFGCFYWLWLAVVVPCGAAEPLYVETDGVVVIEIESVPPSPGWKAEKKQDGYTGKGYYTWLGANSYGGPGLQKPLTFRMLITKAGTYQFRTRNYHAHARRDLANDAWVRMDDGPWVKCFSSQDKKWTWANRFEPSHGKFAPPEYELTSGWHVLQIAGRSHGFSIDRIHLYASGLKGAEDHTRGETRGFPRTLDLKEAPQVAQAWDDGQLGKALAAALKAEGEEAKQAVQMLRDHAAEQMQRIENLKSEDVVGAVTLLKRLSVAYVGSEQGKTFSARLKAWSSDGAYRKELAAQKILQIMQKQAKFLPDKGDVSNRQFAQRYRQPLMVLAQGLKKLSKTYSQTKAYGQAQTLAGRYGLKAG